MTIACVVLLAMYAAGGLYYNAGATVVPRPSGLQSEGNPSLHNDFTMTVYGTTMAYIPVAIGAPILFVRCLLDIFLNDVALCGEDVPLIGRSFHITARGTVRAVLAAILGALAFVALCMPFTKVAEGYSESGLFWAIFFQTKLRSIYYEKEFLGLYLFDTQFALAVVAIVFAVLAFLSPKYRAASSVLSLLCVAFALADAGVSFWLCIMQNEIYNAGAVPVMWIPCLFSLFVGVEYLQALFIRDKGLAADGASDFEDEGAEAEYLVRYYEMYREGLLGEEDFIRLKEQILHRGDEEL